MKRHERATKRQRKDQQREPLPSMQNTRPTSRFWSVVQKLPKGFYAILGFLSLLGSLVIFYPWLSLEFGDRIRPTDPFGIILNISDEGILPLTDISVDCKIDLTTQAGGVH
jgi:hypothetical protein